MRCPNCEARVPIGAEFCPDCATPMSPVLRERRAAAQPAEDDIRARRRRIFIPAVAFLFGLVIGGQASWFNADFNFDPPAAPAHRATIATAPELFAAYQQDGDDAEARFGDRPVVLTGEFLAVAHDGQGQPDLRLKTDNPDKPLGIDIVPGSFDASSRLKRGDMIVVSCDRVAGSGEDPWLQNCAIEEPAALAPPGAAAPAAPALPAPPSAPSPSAPPSPPEGE